MVSPAYPCGDANVISKEDFLLITPGASNRLGVCLVDNRPFTAAAIAFSGWEAKAFCEPSDPRVKIFLSVKIETLVDGSLDLSEREVKVLADLRGLSR